MVLVGLNKVKVSSFTLREAVLAVELELGSHDGVLTPAVHGEGGLVENESASIRNTRVLVGVIGVESVGSDSSAHVGLIVIDAVIVPPLLAMKGVGISSTSIIEETRSINVLVNSIRTSECMDGVRKSVNGVGVVERLGTEKTVEELVALERRAVVDVAIRLDNPDELLNGVVKVELDLVGRRTDGLITSELELLDEVLVGVLGHTSALVGVQEHVVDIERSGNEGLVVSGSDLHGGTGGVVQAGHGPQALLDGADIKVDLDLVVLKSDEGKGQTGVAAEPELKGDVKGGLGESVTGSANLTRGVSIARAIDGVEQGVSDEGQLGGVADHLEVAALLLSGHSKLVPDVHPVTVLAIDTLATDLNLNLRDELLTGEVKPTGIDVASSVLQRLADLGKSHLKVSAVSQITITGDGAGNAATEVGLAVESLLDRLHGKVSVTLVGNLPESNLGVTSQVNVLGAIGDKLHKSSTHCKMLVILLKKKKNRGI